MNGRAQGLGEKNEPQRWRGLSKATGSAGGETAAGSCGIDSHMALSDLHPCHSDRDVVGGQVELPRWDIFSETKGHAELL